MVRKNEISYKEYLHHINTLIFDVDGVLTDGNVTITNNGELLRTMNVKDGYALKTAVDAGCNVCIISGGSNEGVRQRLMGLGITSIFLGVHNKIAYLKKYLKEKNITASQVLYMGDDIPDLEVMSLVGLPCCPKDAIPEIKAISKYVSQRDGGKGAVRDVIEQVLKLKQQWPKSTASAKYD